MHDETWSSYSATPIAGFGIHILLSRNHHRLLGFLAQTYP